MQETYKRLIHAHNAGGLCLWWNLFFPCLSAWNIFFKFASFCDDLALDSFITTTIHIVCTCVLCYGISVDVKWKTWYIPHSNNLCIYYKRLILVCVRYMYGVHGWAIKTTCDMNRVHFLKTHKYMIYTVPFVSYHLKQLVQIYAKPNHPVLLFCRHTGYIHIRCRVCHKVQVWLWVYTSRCICMHALHVLQ